MVDRNQARRVERDEFDRQVDESETASQPGGGTFPLVTVVLLVLCGLAAIAYELFDLSPSDIGGTAALAIFGLILALFAMVTLKK